MMPAPAHTHTQRKITEHCVKVWRETGECIRPSDLHVGEVDAVEVAEHLVDLRSVLQHSTGSLGQVVQRGVPAQRLRKCICTCHLQTQRRIHQHGEQ